jgi:phosphate transport system protein
VRVPPRARRDPPGRRPPEATVTELIPRVTDVLLDQDLEGAEYVIRGDDEIDARAIELEERAATTPRLAGARGSDLRQVVVGAQADRRDRAVGRSVRNICKAARRIYGHPLDPKLRGVIQKMGPGAAPVQGGHRGVRRGDGRGPRH